MNLVAIDEQATILRRARVMPATALMRHGDQKFAYLPISPPNRVTVLHYSVEADA